MSLSKYVRYAITDSRSDNMPADLVTAGQDARAWRDFVIASQAALRREDLFDLRRSWDAQ